MYAIVFSEGAKKDLKELYKKAPQAISKLSKLLDEVKEHPRRGTGQADLDYQGRGQVFEAVCAFLNKNGGTVFIGVNNSGDPIKAENHGLSGDLKWFEGNFDTIRRTRSARLGHPVPQPKDLDSYCLFLNEERALYFKPEVRRFITISPTEDMDAIRIVVDPSRFEIAKLYKDNSWKEGIAYVRDGSATVPMSRVAQQQRLMELHSVGKVEKFIITLTEAIDKQRKVILRDYCSSSSNDKRDRFVVPINLVYNNENLWAYDLEDRHPKEYRLSRIGDIDTDIESPEYAHAFPKGEADIFRWVNDKVNYHIKLDMSLGAYNNLKEEYSDTENLPEEELYSVFVNKVNDKGEPYVEERIILDTTLRYAASTSGSPRKSISLILKTKLRSFRNCAAIKKATLTICLKLSAQSIKLKTCVASSRLSLSCPCWHRRHLELTV